MTLNDSSAQDSVLADSDSIQPAVADFGTLLDARLLSPLDLDDPTYQQEMVISVGANFKSTKWKNDLMTIAKFVTIGARHPEGRHKDGPGFVLGEIIGDNRRKQAVAQCSAIGLDIDVGMPGADIDAALAKLGSLAIRYTTFSHGKTTSKFNKDKIVKWCDKNDVEFGADAVLAFLRAQSKWDPRLLDSAEYVGDSHDPEGLMACVNHSPMEKHRIVIPLAEAFVPTTVAKTHAEGMKLWASVLKATAVLLGDLPMDNSAVDPSRLFYFPRHAKGRPHETTIHGGPLFDWRDLELEGQVDDFDAALVRESGGGGGGKSVTEEGKKLGRWASIYAGRHQIADLIRDHADDHIRTNGATKVEIECPFDEDHSNPGDPEDRGCFAVNAGEGDAPVFVIHCQHDSCQDKTGPDFVGKMLKDGWFGSCVLESDDYNPVVGEDQALPFRAKVDDVFADIDALGSDPHPDDIAKVIETMTFLGPVDLSAAKRRLKKAGVMGMMDADKALKAARRMKARPATDFRVDADGLRIFEYIGDYDSPNVGKALREVMLALNDGDGERWPVITYGVEGVTKMDRAADDSVVFAKLSFESFHARANTLLALVKLDDEGKPGPRKHVALDVAKTVFNNAHHDLPPTPEILRVPVFASTGELLTQDGWREDHGIYMETGALLREDVPAVPTPEDVKAALKLLKDDLLGDFPFLDFDDEGTERKEPALANCLAMLITPFARRLFTGQTPLFWISKPVPGTGATLLGGIPSHLVEGGDPVTMAYSPGNDDENRKELVTACVESRTILFYDDVKIFTARPVIQAITAPVISGRILNRSESVQRPNNFLWLGGGNNTYFGPEMGRRVVQIRLNAKRADIRDRKFKRDLETWVPEHRGEIVRAILILIQNWIAQTEPKFTKRNLPSFEGWAKAVGGILDAAGVTDFLNTRKVAEVDPGYGVTQRFVKAWYSAYRLSKTEAKPLIEWAIQYDLEVVEGRDELERRRRLQTKLADLEGQTFDVGTSDAPSYVTVVRFVGGDDGLAYQLQETDEESTADAAASA